LNTEFEKPYFQDLTSFVKSEYSSAKIFPQGNKIFAAFEFCPLSDLRVVIIGQDPYHGECQANGLCFSVSDGIKSPPSLMNIFKEIKEDLGIPIPESGNLERWAKQGILLLNATLTVRANTAGSHQNKGWEQFTDRVIELVSSEKEKVVFILWGAFAQKKATLIDSSKHLILTSPHPSPFSAYNGFFGNKHFSKTNAYLLQNGLETIVW
jgi:uracil-DNA glycosylase